MWTTYSVQSLGHSAPALACSRPKATDKEANCFIQKCEKKVYNYSNIFLAFNWPVARCLSRSFEVIWTNTGRSATYDFLLVIMQTTGLPRTVSVIKAMIAIFFLSVYLTSPRWGSCGILLRQWAQKTRMLPLSDRQKKFDDMLNHLETVRQTLYTL